MTKKKNIAVNNSPSQNALLVLARMRTDVQAVLRQYVSEAKLGVSSGCQEHEPQLIAR